MPLVCSHPLVRVSTTYPSSRCLAIMLPLTQPPTYPRRTTATIYYRIHNYVRFTFRIINCEWKNATYHPMIIFVIGSMSSGTYTKSFDVRSNRRRKVVAEPIFLLLVKPVAFVQIPPGGSKNSNSHAVRRRPIVSFTLSQSRISSLPDSTALRRSSSNSLCQSGIGELWTCERKSSQSASIN